MTVPVLICATLNRPDLLVRMLASVDVIVDKTVIIDNGGRVPPDIEAIRLPHNIGCGAAWNLGFQVTPTAPWWLVTNDDIEFGEGDLKRLVAAVQPDRAAIYHLLGFAAFAITPRALWTVGAFDQNITPAYDEDVDMSRRCELADVPRIDVGFSGKHVGSATIMSDPALRSLNGMTHSANDRYYAQKWGGPKQGGEMFDTPFDKGGHVGDWRWDIQPLRMQAWPRR